MTAYALGFSFRKRQFLRNFIGKQVKPLHNTHVLRNTDEIYLWGSTPLPHGIPPATCTYRVEDGFLRSVGLGAGLATPFSWVIDHAGIYYDPTRPSDLETILQQTHFTPELLQRAVRVRHKIVATRLSKYNVGNHPWHRSTTARTILVPGQVENDASIKTGAVGIVTNMGLLRAVRDANPDAHIVYKPHPDVVSGLRHADDNEAATLANEVVPYTNIADMLDMIDEVHCITSLTGFEALLRDKRVICYGQPFYAGWGLTHDIAQPLRRTRRLTVDELIAGALILYPQYLHPKTLAPTSVEAVIDGLHARKTHGPTLADKLKLTLMKLVPQQ